MHTGFCYDDLTNYKTTNAPTFTQNIDYMSDLSINEYSLHQCWKRNNSISVRSQQDDISCVIPSTVSRRLENTCWRRWYKQMKRLPEVSPSCINWKKDEDITWLYGPKFDTDDCICSVDLSAGACDSTGAKCDSRNSSVTSLSSTSSLRTMDSDISVDFDRPLEPRNKPASKSKPFKKVKFNYIINSREIINGRSIDYGFLDEMCL
ncbi:unnamed protein product [Debaryomyces fabryi]|nr:unnamed protein product [Debaryomyces fabryi]